MTAQVCLHALWNSSEGCLVPRLMCAWCIGAQESREDEFLNLHMLVATYVRQAVIGSATISADYIAMLQGESARGPVRYLLKDLLIQTRQYDQLVGRFADDFTPLHVTSSLRRAAW